MDTIYIGKTKTGEAVHVISRAAAFPKTLCGRQIDVTTIGSRPRPAEGHHFHPWGCDRCLDSLRRDA